MNQPKGFRSGLGHHGDDENENERKKKDKGHNKGYFVRGGTQNSNVDGKVKVKNSRKIRSFNIKLKVSLGLSNENVFFIGLNHSKVHYEEVRKKHFTEEKEDEPVNKKRFLYRN